VGRGNVSVWLQRPGVFAQSMVWQIRYDEGKAIITADMTQLLDRPAHTTDRSIIHTDRTWAQFKLIQAGFSEARGIKLAFYHGTIEILMPGQDHEIFSRIIGYLITTYLIDQGSEFVSTGAMDQEKTAVAFAQADESFCLGDRKPIPDLAIEVVFTSGTPHKLEKYQALGVREVWFWQDGTLALYHLGASGYDLVDRSHLAELAALDIALLKRCILIGETSLAQAVQTLRAG
jgi:Uma2 family endonuclease